MHQILFIDLFKSAVHVSGDKLASPQEHFLTVCTAFGTVHCFGRQTRRSSGALFDCICSFGTMHRYCFQSAAVSVHCARALRPFQHSYNKTNYVHSFLEFVFGIKLYMLRAVPLSIVRSSLLYTQQWYVSYKFADILRAVSKPVRIAVCTVKNS